MQVTAKLALAAPLAVAIVLAPQPLKADAAPTPSRLYEQARKMAKQRKVEPCAVMFEELRETLKRALEAAPKLRNKARKDRAFGELRGTCMFLRLALGLDPNKPRHLRRMLIGVAWEGTNWGTNQPGPTDTIQFKPKHSVRLNAMKVRGGCPIEGTYSLQGGALLIRGKCKGHDGKKRPVQIKLIFTPETCQLTLNGDHLFSDTPDECNT